MSDRVRTQCVCVVWWRAQDCYMMYAVDRISLSDPSGANKNPLRLLACIIPNHWVRMRRRKRKLAHLPFIQRACIRIIKRPCQQPGREPGKRGTGAHAGVMGERVSAASDGARRRT